MQRPVAFVVEDQMSLSILYEDALRLVGYDVKLFRNGLEAVNAVELYDPPTFIILDVNLPGLSGRDVLQHIRKNPKYDDVPVLIATANSVMAKVIEPEIGEQDRLFIKPMSMIDLQKIAKDVAKKKLDITTQELKSASGTAHNTQSMQAIREVMDSEDALLDDAQAQKPNTVANASENEEKEAPQS
ncbi:MAG: response regulator [Anaerolineae bacterium]|nr:response regulator [Anaerolineae bacterium]